MLFLNRERPVASDPIHPVKSVESRAFEQAFGCVIRRHREALDMGQADLGDALGISAVQVCRIETAQRPVTLDLIIRACKEFDVTPAQLIAGVQREAFPFGWYGDDVDLGDRDLCQLELDLYYA